MNDHQTDISDDDETPAVVDRFTVALIGDAAGALSKLQRRSGLKKVDLLNRAAIVYEFIDAEIRQGKKVILRDENGDEERVKLV